MTPFLKSFKYILGSGSPRRRELLNAMGIAHTVIKFKAEEVVPAGMVPAAVAEHLAQFKSKCYPKHLAADELLITADTIVVLGDEILGKPADAEEATRMLRSLSGREHEVISACCLRSCAKQIVFHDSTTVHFKKLFQEEIDHYIQEFKPFDKAGAYGIQEWIGLIGIEGIAGSYFNVVGLPTEKLYKALSSF